MPDHQVERLPCSVTEAGVVKRNLNQGVLCDKLYVVVKAPEEALNAAITTLET